MKQHLLFLGSMVLLTAAGIMASIGGCGSDDAVGGNSVPDAAQPSNRTSPDVDAAQPTNPTTNPDGSNGNPTDDASTPAVGSTPLKVSCGSTECTTPAEACCTKLQIDGGTSSTCQPTADSCSGGATFACDEAADCSNGELCCRSFGHKCAAKCGAIDVQLCKTASECGDAGPCQEYTCPASGKVMACSKPFGCN